MKLRNKKTGEIKNVNHNKVLIHFNDGQTICINSLAELNEDWEDVEPEEVWYIDFQGVVRPASKEENDWLKENEIGNYFETKEEAEKAVEKLKAWKRLKDKGFKFVGWEDTNNDVNDILFELPYMEWDKNVSDDLDSLFGGEK